MANKLAEIIWALGVFFAAAGSMVHTKPAAIWAAALPPLDSLEPATSGNGFALNAVYPGVASPPPIKGQIELYGSAINGDAGTGQVRTRWYRPLPTFFMLLAGYPANHGENVFLEVYSQSTGTVPVRLQFDENPENWRLQKISLRRFKDATKFRIVATDAWSGATGWVGFSQPFTLQKRDTLQILKQLAMVIICAAAALATALGPGIVLRARFTDHFSTVWLPVPGFLLLAMLGVLAWNGPAVFSPELIARAGILILLLLVGYELKRHPLTTLLSRTELRVLGFVLLLVVIAVAKSAYSIGPSGELYRGHVSRTLEANGRGDSRIPYHVVQLVGLRRGAYSPLAGQLFGPWNFSHRGPMSGLAASPIVLCGNVHLPLSAPNEPWAVFDPQGFTSYRIAEIVFSASSLLVVFGLARLFLDDDWATLAFVAAAAAPFTVHEIFFTWPKIVAAGFVLLGVYLAVKRRFFLAGLSVGLGYLCHPSALLSFPAVFLLGAIPAKCSETGRQKLIDVSRCMALACAGLALWIAFWRWVNHGHFEQGSFFQYFISCGGLPISAANWLRSRWTSTLNTLVPMYAFLFHRLDKDLLPVDGLPQPFVQFMQLYWCSLAAAGGLLFYPSLLRLIGIGFKKAKAWLWLIIMPPFVLFVCYFGAPNTGLMREGLHAWFLGLVVFAIVMWRKHAASSQAFWRFTLVALAVRGVELLFVLVPFASWSRGYVLQPTYALSDCIALIVMLAATLTLCVYVVLYCSRMQRAESNPK
jgi:hypothetical protein